MDTTTEAKTPAAMLPRKAFSCTRGIAQVQAEVGTHSFFLSSLIANPLIFMVNSLTANPLIINPLFR